MVTGVAVALASGTKDEISWSTSCLSNAAISFNGRRCAAGKNIVSYDGLISISRSANLISHMQYPSMLSLCCLSQIKKRKGDKKRRET
jgi:hypothetical protein